MSVGTTNVSLGAIMTEMSKSLVDISLAQTVQNGYLESGSWVVGDGLARTEVIATRGPLDTGSVGTGASFLNLSRYRGYEHANIRFKFDPQYATASVAGVPYIRDTYGPTTGSALPNFTFNYLSASWTTGQSNIVSGAMVNFGATGWFRPVYQGSPVSTQTSSMGYIDFDGTNDYVQWSFGANNPGESYKSYSGSATSASAGYMFWIRVDGNTGGPIRAVWATSSTPADFVFYRGVKFLISGGGATANQAIVSYGNNTSTTNARFFTSSYYLTNAQWYCICVNVNGGSTTRTFETNNMFITPRTSASADITNRLGPPSGAATYINMGVNENMMWGQDRGTGYFNGAIGPFVMKPGTITTTEYTRFFNAWRAATPA